LQRLGTVDVGAYAKAFVLLARNPQIVLAPLLMGVAQLLAFTVLAPGGAAFASSGLLGLVAQLLDGFGFAIALIIAESAWRRGRAPFDDAWDEGRRRLGDILFATFGLGFVMYLAALAGSYIGAAAFAIVAIAWFFFIYTLPAAAIGGFPGGAALNASVERARQAPIPTAVVTAVFLAGTALMPTLLLTTIAPLFAGMRSFGSATVDALVAYAVKAVVEGYLALVLAKTYDNVSYGRSYR